MPRHKEVECLQGATIGIINQKVNDIHKSIYGNGKPGIIDNHEKLTERVTIIETEAKTKEKNWDRIFGTGVFFMILTLLVQVFVAYLIWKGH